MREALLVSAVDPVGSGRSAKAAAVGSFAAAKLLSPGDMKVIEPAAKGRASGSASRVSDRQGATASGGLNLAEERAAAKRSALEVKENNSSKALRTIVQNQRFLADLRARTSLGSTVMADFGKAFSAKGGFGVRNF
jgi:hypothetical protein